MGMCVSKVKQHRKTNKYKGNSTSPVPCEDTQSVLYEDIDIYPAANRNKDSHEAVQTVRASGRNDNRGPSFVRSLTELSRDSAYSDGNFNSKTTSFSSLVQHDGYLCRADYIPHTCATKQGMRSSACDEYLVTYQDMSMIASRGASNPWQSECCAKKQLSSEVIPYMIEVFMPLLQGSIRVLEIIPHLPFIDDTGAFINKDRESPRQAVVMLIDRIKSSEEPGKWQSFLEALSRGGYKYIYDLLNGETEKDFTHHRKLLRLFTPRLVNRIDTQEFIDHLYEKDVIGEADMEEIKCEERNRGPIAASLMLLEYMPRKNPDWYAIFVDVLKKCGLEDMVDDFDIPGENDTHPSCSSGSVHPSATCSFSNHKSVCQLSSWDASERINPNGSKNRESHTSTSDDEYITPINDDKPTIPTRPPRATDRQRHVSGRFDNTPLYVTSEELDGDHYTRPYLDGSAEIARLQKLKASLEQEVEEKRLTKQLMKDIGRLQKELLAIENDDASEEDERKAQVGRLPEATDSGTRYYNTRVQKKKENLVLLDNSSQTQQSDTDLCRILQDIGDLKSSVSKLKDEVTTEIQTMKSKTVTESKLDLPTSDLIPLYRSKLQDRYVPMPHLTRMASFDSGAFSDYLSMSSENYF